MPRMRLQSTPVVVLGLFQVALQVVAVAHVGEQVGMVGSLFQAPLVLLRRPLVVGQPIQAQGKPVARRKLLGRLRQDLLVAFGRFVVAAVQFMRLGHGHHQVDATLLGVDAGRCRGMSGAVLRQRRGGRGGLGATARGSQPWQ